MRHSQVGIIGIIRIKDAFRFSRVVVMMVRIENVRQLPIALGQCLLVARGVGRVNGGRALGGGIVNEVAVIVGQTPKLMDLHGGGRQGGGRLFWMMHPLFVPNARHSSLNFLFSLFLTFLFCVF